ncbi:hypothetical protein PVAR5_1031 [Paecilomyces variotii No. 5]|uniref:Uncharacterized protein n=1 Tax=Byssochlamys spectabilis (strain No. 5 / NBRC 109023) TaxID=1356009 RepID=V5HSN1_BYSSN|nr:hypothetical protein PVAR5_1031 [Paecilomyces variotii No. 5]
MKHRHWSRDQLSIHVDAPELDLSLAEPRPGGCWPTVQGIVHEEENASSRQRATATMEAKDEHGATGQLHIRNGTKHRHTRTSPTWLALRAGTGERDVLPKIGWLFAPRVHDIRRLGRQLWGSTRDGRRKNTILCRVAIVNERSIRADACSFLVEPPRWFRFQEKHKKKKKKRLANPVSHTEITSYSLSAQSQVAGREAARLAYPGLSDRATISIYITYNSTAEVPSRVRIWLVDHLDYWRRWPVWHGGDGGDPYRFDKRKATSARADSRTKALSPPRRRWRRDRRDEPGKGLISATAGPALLLWFRRLGALTAPVGPSGPKKGISRQPPSRFTLRSGLAQLPLPDILYSPQSAPPTISISIINPHSPPFVASLLLPSPSTSGRQSLRFLACSLAARPSPSCRSPTNRPLVAHSDPPFAK